MIQLALHLDNFEPPWLEAFFYANPMTCTDDLMDIVMQAIINQREYEEKQA